MQHFVLISGGVLGLLAVVFGAFGAHALKKVLDREQQKSFETGVKYQMYHSLILIMTGIVFPFLTSLQHLMAWCFLIGTFLFSFSIYGLVLSDSRGTKWRFLGPITPLGGLLLVIGWFLFVLNVGQLSDYL